MKKLGFGLMRLPTTDPEDQKTVDLEKVIKMIDCFIEQGFSYFDTGWWYHGGISEVSFRKAIAERYPRDKFTIADKMPLWHITGNADYQKFFSEQQKRCGVEYFDYYLLHGMDNNNYDETLKYGGFEFVRKLKSDNKARKIGFSFHDKADVLERILSGQKYMDFVQLQINYLDWDDHRIQSRECYEVALKHNIPIYVMEPVKGSCLAALPAEAAELLKSYDKTASAASWALRFAASLENVALVLSGMNSMEQVIDNMAVMKDPKPLDKDEHEIIKQVVDIIKSKIKIPCTYCRYCIGNCPNKIPIPRYLSLYNEQYTFGLLFSLVRAYNIVSANAGKAFECTGCGQCEKQCPQHIPIIESLKEFSLVFEKNR